MRTFKNKTVLITGAASGIGRCLAEHLASRKAQLVLADLDSGVLDQVVTSIKKRGGTAVGKPLDVTDETAFKNLIDDAMAEHGRLDYIFNNAGIAIAGEVRDTDVANWKKVLDVNLNGVIYGSVHAYKAMVKQGSGHIVNIASLEGLIPFPFTVSYVTSKYAVIGLSNALRVEGAHLGVDVSVVCPGFIQTPIFDVSEVVNVDRQQLLKNLPMAFSITPEACSERIIKGVARNKAIIPVTGLTRILWWLARISPSLVIWLVSKQHAKTANEIRAT